MTEVEVEANATKKSVSKEKSPKDKSSFGKDFKAELKRVTWPTPKQLVNNTTAVPTVPEPQNVTPVNTTVVPQTGEYDTYIIAGIAVVVVAIGAFSFINSRRYN